MKQKTRKTYLSCFLIFLLCISLTACGDTPDNPGNDSPGGKPSNSESTSTEKGSRDNTSVVLEPEASGSSIQSCESATIDTSNCAEGYIMADYHGTNPKVKLQIKGPDGVTYSYNLHGGYEVFPLTAGNGTYTIGVYENISGTKYSTALSCSVDVTITNEFGPYLYPNQYVNFTAASLPVGKAVELAYTANNDLEVVESVYNYMIRNFTYDYDKAATVKSGYLPVVDEVFKSNTGICFDYASVMATMLRTQNIPTRLEVGYVGEEYHAWISTYIKDVGWVNGIIEFDGTDWNLLDPTFASTSKSPTKFITENSSYLTKYVY